MAEEEKTIEETTDNKVDVTEESSFESDVMALLKEVAGGLNVLQETLENRLPVTEIAEEKTIEETTDNKVDVTEESSFESDVMALLKEVAGGLNVLQETLENRLPVTEIAEEKAEEAAEAVSEEETKEALEEETTADVEDIEAVDKLLQD